MNIYTTSHLNNIIIFYEAKISCISPISQIFPITQPFSIPENTPPYVGAAEIMGKIKERGIPAKFNKNRLWNNSEKTEVNIDFLDIDDAMYAKMSN